MYNPAEEKLKIKVEEILKPAGINLVEFKIFLSARTVTVRCLIDYPQGGVTVEVCSRANKDIVSFLDSSKLLGEDYVVEVNSPGLDRRLTAHKDFLRVQGRVVSLWFKQPFEGREYLEGELVDLNQAALFLKSKGDIFKINFSQIRVGKEKLSC